MNTESERSLNAFLPLNTSLKARSHGTLFFFVFANQKMSCMDFSDQGWGARPYAGLSLLKV